MGKPTHNCFVSYYHLKDKIYIARLRQVIAKLEVSDHSLKYDIGHLADSTIYRMIREKMRNCSITIILVGEHSGSRKWIDWEIWASLRAYRHPYDSYKSFKPNGILAIFLPGKVHYIPKRLQDNIDSGYAVCMKWENLERDFESKVKYAYFNRSFRQDRIDNSRTKQKRNLTIK